MIPIVPLLFAAPKYISGELTLGQVTQLAAAFVAGADRHLLGGRQLQPRRRVVRLGAPRDGHRRRLRRHRPADRGDFAQADATHGTRRAPRCA